MQALAAALILASQSIEYSPDSYSILCETEGLRGFRSSASGYSPAEFRADKYLVTKGPNVTCHAVLKPPTVFTPTVAYKEVCLNIRPFGQDLSTYDNQVCNETYSSADMQIQCYRGPTSFRLEPDGGFLTSSISGLLSNPEPGQDITVGWGRCSRIA